MVQPSERALALAHQFPPPFPEGVPWEQAVVIRYDGVKLDDTDVIYAVIGSEDLARLPETLIGGLDFNVRGVDGNVKGSPHAFFIGSERQLKLCVNTDAYPDFTKQVSDAALDAGLIPLNAEGDLRLMTGPDGDVSSPEIPAFVKNGMGYVPSLMAISYLNRNRPEKEPDAGPDIF